ncbi:MAG: hypothetical protein AAF383_12690 [Cyanobacteria bacterium P01_A01_bin.83]
MVIRVTSQREDLPSWGDGAPSSPTVSNRTPYPHSTAVVSGGLERKPIGFAKNIKYFSIS